MFLCLLWPSPVNAPLPNFAKGSSMSRFLIYMDAQDAQDFFQETAGFRFRESAQSAWDHRPSRLLVQEALVGLILCILCIDVH